MVELHCKVDGEWSDISWKVSQERLSDSKYLLEGFAISLADPEFPVNIEVYDGDRLVTKGFVEQEVSVQYHVVVEG